MRPPLTRRDALCRIGNGFGMAAFASALRAAPIVFLFMNGGVID